MPYERSFVASQPRVSKSELGPTDLIRSKQHSEFFRVTSGGIEKSHLDVNSPELTPKVS